MEIDVEAARGRKCKQPVQPPRKNGWIFLLGEPKSDAAEPSFGFGDDIDDRGVFRRIIQLCRDQCAGLELDAISPPIAQLSKHAEADLRLARDKAVDMRPDRRRPVGISALQ